MKINTLSDIFIRLEDEIYCNYYLQDESSFILFKDFFYKVKSNVKQIYSNVGTQKRFFIKSHSNIFFVEALFSTICSGNIAIPINPDLDNEKIEQLKLKFKIDYIVDYELPYMSLKNNDLPEIKPIDNALALFTSGTTGESKLVLMNHENILFNAYSVIENMAISKPENIAIILPLYHSFALITQLITTFLTGGNIHLINKSNSYNTEFILKHNINTIAGVPTNFKMLLFGEKKEYSNIKHITIAGASLDKKLAEQINQSFPNADLWIGYGLTECGPRVTAINYNDKKFKEGSVGKPIKGVEILIKDNEVLIKSKSNMVSYLDDIEATNKKIIEHYLYSGDTGYIDEDNYLYITGRKDDIFISSGEKISPLLIEKVLNSHKNIIMSAVFGEEDNILGKRIIALVKLKEEDSITSKDLLVHCYNLLEKYQIPHKFFKIDGLPMTSNGKIMRKELPLWKKEKI